jgi:hypothetical protein
MKFGGWVEKFEEELEKTGLGLVGRYQCGSNEKKMCRITKLRYNDKESIKLS